MHMLKKIKKALLFQTIVLLSFAYGQNEYDSLINRGIKQIYNIKFENASQTFNTLKKHYPEKPAGVFMEAMTLWWEIMLDLQKDEMDDLFYDKIDEVVDFCDGILDENELDSDALFFKGGALGFRGLLNSIRQNWFEAAGDGADALPLVNKVYEIDSTNIDVRLGFGIYNYFAAALPEKYPVAKPLLFFIPEGDKEQGIADLKQVSENGKYTSIEARFTLGKIFYLYEKKYDTAISYFKNLHREFPDNPVFERYFGRSLLSKYGYGSDSVFTRILEKHEIGKTGYTSFMAREAHYYVGMKYKNNHLPEMAMTHFNKCAEISRKIDTEEESGFWINSLLYAGMMNDVLNNREKAVSLYEEVLDKRDYKKAQEKAEKYIEKPYKMEGFGKKLE